MNEFHREAEVTCRIRAGGRTDTTGKCSWMARSVSMTLMAADFVGPDGSQSPRPKRRDSPDLTGAPTASRADSPSIMGSPQRRIGR